MLDFNIYYEFFFSGLKMKWLLLKIILVNSFDIICGFDIYINGYM